MYKSYKAYERQDMRCIAVDGGAQCERGVRNQKRMLCNKHNTRWQRYGKVDCVRAYVTQDVKEEQRRKSRRLREEQLKKAWASLTCLCIHTYAEHKIKGRCCLTPGCPCKVFSSASVEAVKQMKDRMTMMGFVEPIGDEAYCLRCQEYIQIGRWFDGNIVQRMREHLRGHLAQKWGTALDRRPA
jgi:hypothetical protein